VRIFTRNLNDITDRMPEVVAIVRGLPAEQVVLDGEALLSDGRVGSRHDGLTDGAEPAAAGCPAVPGHHEPRREKGR